MLLIEQSAHITHTPCGTKQKGATPIKSEKDIIAKFYAGRGGGVQRGLAGAYDLFGDSHLSKVWLDWFSLGNLASAFMPHPP